MSCAKAVVGSLVSPLQCPNGILVCLVSSVQGDPASSESAAEESFCFLICGRNSWLCELASFLSEVVCTLVAWEAYMCRHPLEGRWGCLGKGCEGGLKGLDKWTRIRGVKGLECGHGVSEDGDAAKGLSTGGEEFCCCFDGQDFSSEIGAELSSRECDAAVLSIGKSDVDSTASVVCGFLR